MKVRFPNRQAHRQELLPVRAHAQTQHTRRTRRGAACSAPFPWASDASVALHALRRWERVRAEHPPHARKIARVPARYPPGIPRSIGRVVGAMRAPFGAWVSARRKRRRRAFLTL